MEGIHGWLEVLVCRRFYFKEESRFSPSCPAVYESTSPVACRVQSLPLREACPYRAGGDISSAAAIDCQIEQVFLRTTHFNICRLHANTRPLAVFGSLGRTLAARLLTIDHDANNLRDGTNRINV